MHYHVRYTYPRSGAAREHIAADIDQAERLADAARFLGRWTGVAEVGVEPCERPECERFDAARDAVRQAGIERQIARRRWQRRGR